jgi:type II secretory pathway pseudopilin PulG
MYPRNLKQNLSTRSVGFTLIEVLIAGVIMIMVISSTLLIYQGALISSQKAERTVKISAAIPYLLESIRQEIRHSNADEPVKGGSGQWLSVHYSWSSELLEKRAAPAYFDPELGEETNFPARYKLWQVILTVAIEGYEKQYEFHEVSW